MYPATDNDSAIVPQVMANEQPSRFGNEPCSRPSAFTRFD